jgi:hypothetical protein
MGIFGWVKGLVFRKKKEPEPIADTGPEDLGALTPLREEREGLTPAREPLSPRETLPPIEPMAPPRVEPEGGIEASNLKAKIDLVLTKMENISIQNRTIDERLKAIEKTLAEMRGIRYY